MRKAVTMPRMGQSMDEGRVLRWFKETGAEVKHGEVIAEIETDKTVVEMEAFASGTLVEIVVPAGELVPTGTTIAYLDDGQPEPGRPPTWEPALSASSLSSPAEPHAQSASEEEEQPAPQGTRISASPVARRLADECGVDLSRVKGTGAGGRIAREDVEAYLAQCQATRPSRVNASPIAKRLAEDQGIDLTQVQGHGPGGRIGKADVEAWLEAQREDAPVPLTEEVRRVPLSKIKLTTARRMTESKTTAPHFYVSTDIEMSQALALRAWLKGQGQEVSINDLILKAAALALARYPHLNATFAGDELHVHPHVNLAVAVALNDGLITPIIHQCERLSLPEIATAAKEMIERARAGRLRPEDLEGGTFTVSNLGMFGVKHFKAIVNPPQAAILTVGSVRRLPVFDAHDRIVPAQLLTATVSADHRVTDGAEVAKFLMELKAVLEAGFSLMSAVQLHRTS
jgi:pyruvate dehydrogenase E2 component (dihydrolipoamide acetyltransferase)